MGWVTEACKQRIRERVPLEELVREYNVQLVPSGKRLKGLCPFHAEKTPSFSIDVEKQYYYCFGCHAGGDLFSFVKSMHHVEYPEALEILARRAGVALEYTHGAGASGDGRERERRERIVGMYDAVELAQRLYHRFLLHDPAARPARDYLERRGIDRRMWERFQLGFSPLEWDGLLRHAAKDGFSPQALEQAGLARRRENGGGYYDYFRGRVMFLIQDAQGRGIGFGARTLGDDQPKYLNTPKTALFDKSQVLYALPQARAGIQREGRLAIVEGYTDAIMAHQAGLDFFVASLGTAFTQENARRIGRLAPRALLIFDGDAAGQRASERSLDLLVGESIDVRVYTVRDGKDPCDAILELGGPEFRRRVEADAVGIFEFKWRRTMETGAGAEAGAALKARAFDELLALLARVPNVVARKLQLRELSERLGVPETDIEARLRQISRGRAASTSWQGTGARSAWGGSQGLAGAGRVREPSPEGPERGGMSELETVILECLLALPSRAKDLWGQVPRELFRSPAHAKLADAIERQLAGADLSVTRLAQEVEDPQAGQLLGGLLSRLENDQGEPTQDYEEVWTRVVRDLQRLKTRARLEDLKGRLSLEPDLGRPQEDRSVLEREYFEILRELKRG
ncbi:MAG: DNA primase [Planctomycetes bacterium]|nr:DNA primase [Planctomycetota bacterium]